MAFAFTPAASARVIVGGGVYVGAPYYYYPPYYSYPYYSYAPPVPPPQYVPPPPQYIPNPPPPSYQSDDGQTCREYSHVVTVEGRRQKAYGTACLQPDGSWKIVN